MRPLVLLAAAVVLACAPRPAERPAESPAPRIDPAPTRRPPVRVPPPEEEPERVAPPDVAYAHGFMPLASTGVDRFVRENPTFDGRGVLIAILDTGVDPGAPGLATTSTGDPKLVDVRDFSGEGLVPLTRVTPQGDTVEVAGRRLGGFGRVVALSTAGPYYAGVLRELALGQPPAADLDGDGVATDTLPLVVARATDGWVVVADTDGDGSLAGERPVRDYLLSRETFGWAARGRAPRANLAANFSERDGEPVLDLVYALDSHGTHVAGIAAAHDLYGVRGFHGVAPGAQLLGLKISDRANGSVSTTGAILAAMDYAIRFAANRRQPLVINLSFGVGNEQEGEARIDQLIDSVLAAHPALYLTVSAGNDGPGLSTIGFPGSAGRGISVGGTLPAVFLPPDQGGGGTDLVADFSARGGELAKPDVVAPGVAYSSVPRWDAGDEVKQGTSMAAPHAAGAVALLVSALAQQGRSVDARTLRHGLMVTARPAPRGGYLDEGRGLLDAPAAHAWLLAGGRSPGIEVSVDGTSGTAAWVTAGPRAPKVGTQRFLVRRLPGTPPATYTLRSDVPWLEGPREVTLTDEVTTVELKVATTGFVAPNAYTGIVSGWPADTLAGPGFRLVTTVLVPAPVRDSVALRSSIPVQPGEALRSFFTADSARPFEVRVSAALGERGLAYLHEPGGAPFREGSPRPLGLGRSGAVYRVDARDVVPGAYQVAASAAPGKRLSVSSAVVHAPVLIGAGREGEVARADLANVSRLPVAPEVELRLRGAQRRDTVRAEGPEARRLAFDIPAWATGLEVDVTMEAGQWGRFTDFGVTVLDSVGRQIAQDPMEYAVGRLSTALPSGRSGTRAVLSLLPGLADPHDRRPWVVATTIRLYADSAVALTRAGSAAPPRSLAPGKRAAVRFVLPASPWPLPAGFAPLGVVLVRIGEQVWTRETGFGSTAEGSAP